MLLILFTIIVYVFFIYGVIEFFKKVYLDITKRGMPIDKPDIQVMINDIEDLEYTIRSLKKDFNHIVIILTDDIEEIPKTISDIGEGVNIEFRHLTIPVEAREL